MSSRSRNGIRNLNRRLDRGRNKSLDRGLTRYATAMLGGARRPRQPNYLAIACRLLNQCLRLNDRMAKRDPHIFGPYARRYFEDTVRLEKEHAESEAALRKVYGSPTPDAPAPVSTLWTDRYDPPPKQHRMFLKWFHENYPSPSCGC
ncbi:MAG: hypothetical protein HZA90_22535 [Verrucomicrobia bacterium]|nr:hypothetical protein [Verrucomicrobiota bacterium]